MKNFFYVLLAFLVFAVVQSLRYKNPYRLHFIFGKKGAGKSLYLTKMMLRYQRKGWNIYTDMHDVNISGVRYISPSSFVDTRPEPHSALFLDEAGITYDNRKFKSFPDGVRDFYKYLRKMQCCCYLDSQSYDIDKKIRDTVDELYLMQSVGGWLGILRPIKRQITLTEPTSEAESRIADKLKFRSIFSWKFTYFPKYFKYFDTKAMPERELMPYEQNLTAGPVKRSVFSRIRSNFRDIREIARTQIRDITRRRK